VYSFSPASVGRHAARGAGQQAHAEPRLEPADRVAERRLRHAHLGGGAREAALARDEDEGLQVVEVGTGHGWAV
jgi:hypothetical protein